MQTNQSNCRLETGLFGHKLPRGTRIMHGAAARMGFNPIRVAALKRGTTDNEQNRQPVRHLSVN